MDGRRRRGLRWCEALRGPGDERLGAGIECALAGRTAWTRGQFSGALDRGGAWTRGQFSGPVDQRTVPWSYHAENRTLYGARGAHPLVLSREPYAVWRKGAHPLAPYWRLTDSAPRQPFWVPGSAVVCWGGAAQAAGASSSMLPVEAWSETETLPPAAVNSA